MKNILQIDAQTGRAWLTDGRQKVELYGVIEIRENALRDKVQVVYAGGIIESTQIEMITGPKLIDANPDLSDWPEEFDG